MVVVGRDNTENEKPLEMIFNVYFLRKSVFTEAKLTCKLGNLPETN